MATDPTGSAPTPPPAPPHTTPPMTGAHASLVERAKNILMTPKTEWPVIAAEPATIGEIYRNYVIILAAIPPLAMAIGLFLMGSGYWHFPVGFIVGQAVLSYILALIGVYVLALIIEALAPTFDGSKDRLAAFKLAAYSMTASWLAGIFWVIPVLGFLSIVGLYSLYLFWLGLPVMMKSPPEKSAGYAIAIIVAAIVIYAVIGIIASRIMWTMMPPVTTPTVTFNLPG